MAQSLEITLESHVKTLLEGSFINGIVCMMMSTLVGDCKIYAQCERAERDFTQYSPGICQASTEAMINENLKAAMSTLGSFLRALLRRHRSLIIWKINKSPAEAVQLEKNHSTYYFYYFRIT